MLRDLSPFPQDEDTHVFMTGATGLSPPNNDTETQQHTDPLDDVFGSAPSSPTLASSSGEPHNEQRPRPRDDPSDIPRLRSTHVTNGYREGVTASKGRYMQEGFDEGYTLGAELGVKAGWCLGALEGIWWALPAADAAGTLRDGQSEVERGQALGRAGVVALRREAEGELDIGQLCGKEFLGEDGIWVYDVPGAHSQEEVTFEQVAAAHPVLRKWLDKVRELSAQLGLKLEGE